MVTALGLLKLFIIETIRFIAHNPEHYVSIKLWGEEIKACSRCLGVYVSCLIFFPIFGYIYVFTDITIPFWYVIIASFTLASFTIVDWTSVHIFHYREGTERVRVATGFCLGLSGSLYFWLLPESWWFRIGTLITYNLLAILLAYFGMRKEEKHDKAQADTSI